MPQHLPRLACCRLPPHFKVNFVCFQIRRLSRPCGSHRRSILSKLSKGQSWNGHCWLWYAMSSVNLGLITSKQNILTSDERRTAQIRHAPLCKAVGESELLFYICVYSCVFLPIILQVLCRPSALMHIYVWNMCTS